MFDFHRRVMRVFGGNRVIVMDTEGCERAFRHDFAPEAVVAPVGGVGAIVFECAVLYEVGVESAVAGVADVFVEDAPQVGADGAHARFVECGGEFVGHDVAVSRIFVSRGDGNGGWDRHRTSLFVRDRYGGLCRGKQDAVMRTVYVSLHILAQIQSSAMEAIYR